MAGAGPAVSFRWLETLWVQVTGTLCNLACAHCFISCGPKATQVPVMRVEEVQRALDEGRDAGMRHVYYTGGEPFLHPDIQTLVERALDVAALTVVTNGILLDQATVHWLAAAFARSRNALDIRVSLDGMTARQNDVVRGRGTFEKIARPSVGWAKPASVRWSRWWSMSRGWKATSARQLPRLRPELGIRQPRVKSSPCFTLAARCDEARASQKRCPSPPSSRRWNPHCCAPAGARRRAGGVHLPHPGRRRQRATRRQRGRGGPAHSAGVDGLSDVRPRRLRCNT